MAKLKEGSTILKTDGEKPIATKDEIPAIINNLTSTSTTETLSANQGRILSEKIDAAIQAAIQNTWNGEY